MKSNQNKMSTYLTALLDFGDYMLHLSTMIGSVALVIYTVWHVITYQSWSALLFVIIAASLLAINIVMRTRPTTRGGGVNP